MKEIAVHTDQLKELAPTLRAGDQVIIRGQDIHDGKVLAG